MKTSKLFANMKSSVPFTVLIALTLTACNAATPSSTPLDVEGSEASAPSSPDELATPTEVFVAPPNPEPGADTIGDPYFEEMGNGGYNAQHYAIELDVDMEENSISGSTTIDLETTETLTSLNLDFLGLTVDAVEVNGLPAEFSRDGQELTIYLPFPAQAGELLSVMVSYHGVPGEGIDYSLFPQYSEGWTYYGDGAMVAGEPTGSSNWYPVNEHPLDKAAYSFAITVNDPYEVAANGVLQNVEQDGGLSTYYWEIDDPIGPYMVTVGIAEFDTESYIGPSGVAIRNYFGKDIPDSTRANFVQAGEMVAFYESVFGPYPFDVFGVVVHDVDLSFSLETATLVVFGNSFTDEFVVAHELAHMWFGDSIALERWQDIWLNEGFATYAATLWKEHDDGRAAMDEEIRTYYTEVSFLAMVGAPPIGDPGPDGLFDWPVYARGALTLHALRLDVGDETFFDILRTYYERFRDGNANTDEFIAVAEEVSGQQLDEFFDAWLYKVEMPDIPQMDLSAEDLDLE